MAKVQIKDFVSEKHKKQQDVLERYQIPLDIYAESAIGEAGRIHASFSAEIFDRLYENGVLSLEATMQFFDSDQGVFLNGRQVRGYCPIQGCKSETAYADECSLGQSSGPPTGKTLVPFRLSGNVNWGIPVPERDGLSALSFWVWPGSLWAPISYTKAILGDGAEGSNWEAWWKSDDAKVYQFIGEDNIYFYGIAEMGMLKALDEGFSMPLIVPNQHILFGKTKASSSSQIKPPKAAELLEFYTVDQLRLHFMNTNLSERSMGFELKAFMKNNEGFDTVLNEGNSWQTVFM